MADGNDGTPTPESGGATPPTPAAGLTLVEALSALKSAREDAAKQRVNGKALAKKLEEKDAAESQRQEDELKAQAKYKELSEAQTIQLAKLKAENAGNKTKADQFDAARQAEETALIAEIGADLVASYGLDSLSIEQRVATLKAISKKNAPAGGAPPAPPAPKGAPRPAAKPTPGASEFTAAEIALRAARSGGNVRAAAAALRKAQAPDQ